MADLEILHPFQRYFSYRNGPKFLDRLVSANSADPDQTAPGGESLFVILSASFGHITPSG